MTTTSPGWNPPPRAVSDSPGWQRPVSDKFVRVLLGSVELHTTRIEPDVGEWLLSMAEWSGWEEPAPLDTEEVAHPSGDGQIPGVQRLGPRPITLSGLVKASSDYGHGSLTEALSGLSRIRRATFRVVEREGLTREADVRVSRLQSTRRGLRVAPYTLSLVADDPLRYSGETVSRNGQVLLSNRGDEVAWPLIRVLGGSTVTIVSATGTFRVTIPSSVIHTINCREGIIWNSAGWVVDAATTTGPWPRVPPGGDMWTISGVPAGQVTISRHEAWS